MDEQDHVTANDAQCMSTGNTYDVRVEVDKNDPTVANVTFEVPVFRMTILITDPVDAARVVENLRRLAVDDE